MGFYAYLWMREDGTPYYAGKGKGKRAFEKRTHRVKPPTNISRILIFPRASESEAFETEKELIRNWGRKDIGTGCLRNMTAGGENPPVGRLKGRKLSEDHKQKLAAAKRGSRGNNTGHTHSAETRRKMSKPRSHRWTLTEETKKCQSAAAILREAKKKEQGIPSGQKLGYKHTAETKKKISDGKKGKKSWNKGLRQTTEHIAKLSAVRKGKPWSEQRRKRHEDKKNGKL